MYPNVDLSSITPPTDPEKKAKKNRSHRHRGSMPTACSSVWQLSYRERAGPSVYITCWHRPPPFDQCMLGHFFIYFKYPYQTRRNWYGLGGPYAILLNISLLPGNASIVFFPFICQWGSPLTDDDSLVVKDADDRLPGMLLNNQLFFHTKFRLVNRFSTDPSSNCSEELEFMRKFIYETNFTENKTKCNEN